MSEGTKPLSVTIQLLGGGTAMYHDNILNTIGNTPLVRLNKVTEGVAATVLAKLEYFNPGESVKDRMALFILQDAEKRGLLKPGGTVVEATTGNTGVGLAMYAAVKGYKAVFTIPDNMSEEKIALLKAFGARVVVCPSGIPPDSSECYYEVAKSIAKETSSVLYVNQYHNQANPEAHYCTTGPEIWEQTEGKIDFLVGGVGTGGTISGTGRYLKEKKPEVKVIAVDPIGSVFYEYFKTKKLGEHQPYHVEGIGRDMLCQALQFDVLDDMVQVADKDAFLMARRMASEEGIFAGGSSGAAVWAALEVARDLDSDTLLVVILPDTGGRYLSKIYNDSWMREQGFL